SDDELAQLAALETLSVQAASAQMEHMQGEHGQARTPQRFAGGRQSSAAQQQLLNTIERTIIPGLLRKHADRVSPTVSSTVAPSTVAPPSSTTDAMPLESHTVEALVQYVLLHQSEAGLGFVLELERRGTAIGELFMGLLAPCARRLGEMWVADECSFADVTLGMCRLHQILRSMKARFLIGRSLPLHSLQVLLSPACGEQHFFGLSMVATFFERAGWRVNTRHDDPLESLERLVARERFEVAGLSVSCDFALQDLGAQIARLREVSCNPALIVMVGGPAVLREPSLVRSVGADLTAQTAESAVLVAENALSVAA
ncbi:MAG: cobalamin B12-binding domain-containing protein, partial [Gammaproteobacteria bacterium]|nr:cobalamin B12-binding domain-containing protein [Gammaproteobacteria bacterium]